MYICMLFSCGDDKLMSFDHFIDLAKLFTEINVYAMYLYIDTCIYRYIYIYIYMRRTHDDVLANEAKYIQHVQNSGERIRLFGANK